MSNQKQWDWEQSMDGGGTPIWGQWDVIDDTDTVAIFFQKDAAVQSVRDHNSHDALVAALEESVDLLARARGHEIGSYDINPVIDRIDAALTLAKGTP